MFQLDWTRSSSDTAKIIPDKTSLTYAKAIALFRRGELNSADKLMSDLLYENKSDAWLAEFAGDIDMSAGRPKQAVIHYTDALHLHPSPQISLSLGRALVATNDKAVLNEAIKNLLAAELKPDGACETSITIAYGRNGQLAEAYYFGRRSLMGRDKSQKANGKACPWR